MIHTAVCKHIHIVDLIYNKSTTHPSSDNQDDEFLKSTNYFTETLAKETPICKGKKHTINRNERKHGHYDKRVANSGC